MAVALHHRGSYWNPIWSRNHGPPASFPRQDEEGQELAVH